MCRGLKETTGLFQAVEIGDNIGAVFGFAQSGKGHIGARRIFFRVFQETVKRFIIPSAAHIGQSAGIGKAVMLTNGAVNNAVKGWADFIGAALFKAVAGDAFFWPL